MFQHYVNLFRQWVKPHSSIPVLPWTAESTWSLSLKRLLILSFGLFLFGIGEAFLIVSDIGNSPWTVLSEGVSKQFDLTIGVATLIISVLVLLLWIPLKERPGFGTLLGGPMPDFGNDSCFWVITTGDHGD